MRKKRILIVDDSVLIRRSLTDALSRDPRFEVAGSAPDGHIALLKLPLLHPDVVLLDVEMPGTDTLETLAAIRKGYPDLPVILLNVPGNCGIGTTFDALASGAADYVTKPDVSTNPGDGVRNFCEELASKVVLYCPGFTPEQPYSNTPAPDSTKETLLRITQNRSAVRVDVLAIGVSTGGPNALMDLIPRFPADFPVPILIVQHMPPMFTQLLAERLAAKCKIRVVEGRPDQIVQPGTAWIAPGGVHMVIEMREKVVRIQTQLGPPENYCRPSVDVLFRSVVQVYGAHVLAAVMTGMGHDGLQGCEQVHAAGGQVLAQDEASSVIWGMPGLIVKAGIAHQILPLSGFGPEIMDRVLRYRPAKGALVGH
jgi:two-component system chemotaxis response regulator CheB